MFLSHIVPRLRSARAFLLYFFLPALSLRIAQFLRGRLLGARHPSLPAVLTSLVLMTFQIVFFGHSTTLLHDSSAVKQFGGRSIGSSAERRTTGIT